MYCTRCGKEIRSDQKFCGNCGAKNVNYKEKNDLKEMIEKAAAGEENALEKIYNLTYVQGFAIALQMVKNEQDAMDIMQDAYISAFRNLKQIEDPKRLKSWFNCIVADEKYFYHCCITSHFLVFLGISGFVSPCKKLLSGINWCVMAYVIPQKV